MDRLKSISSSVRAKVPRQEPKPSYAGYSDSRASTAGKNDGATGKIKGLVPDRVTGLIKRNSGPEDQHTQCPRSALKVPSSFAPPPRHRAAHGDEAAAAPIGVSARGPPPPPPNRSPTVRSPSLLQRGSAVEAPPKGRPALPSPPHLPPRRGTAPLPESRTVVEEDIAIRGGLSTGAVGALERLGNSGIKISGFETARASLPPPTTGTPFADKEAAVQTANALYKDPSKVSFSDARVAASTARNFQQRHGDQVAEGAKIAHKYGVIGTAAVPHLSTAQASPPSQPYQSRPSLPPLPAKKKAPPPLPAKKKPPPPPPPPPPVFLPPRPPPVPQHFRSASTPSPVYGCSLPNSGYPHHLLPEVPLDLDLCLHSEWFTTNPLRLPPSIQNNPNRSYKCFTSWTRNAAGRTTHSLILAVLWTTNLSSTKMQLVWDASAPAATVKATQRHFRPPSPLTFAELQARAAIGPKIVRWCEDRMGTQVGDGECWTLAYEALQATPGMMASHQTSHGACILSHYTPSPPVESGIEITAGDILQFWKAKWTFANGAWKNAGDPDHTAVVTGAIRQPNGAWVCQVLEQNVGGVRRVVRGEYSIGQNSGMKEGAVRVFRPTYEGWVSFDSEWDG